MGCHLLGAWCGVGQRVEVVSAELRGNPADDEALGLQLATELRAKGADAILEKLAHCK